MEQIENNRRVTVVLIEGFRAILDRKAESIERPISWVINKYIEEGLRRDGLLPAKHAS